MMRPIYCIVYDMYDIIHVIHDTSVSCALRQAATVHTRLTTLAKLFHRCHARWCSEGLAAKQRHIHECGCSATAATAAAAPSARCRAPLCHCPSRSQCPPLLRRLFVHLELMWQCPDVRFIQRSSHLWNVEGRGGIRQVQACVRWRMSGVGGRSETGVGWW